MSNYIKALEDRIKYYVLELERVVENNKQLEKELKEIKKNKMKKPIKTFSHLIIMMLFITLMSCSDKDQETRVSFTGTYTATSFCDRNKTIIVEDKGDVALIDGVLQIPIVNGKGEIKSNTIVHRFEVVNETTIYYQQYLESNGLIVNCSSDFVRM